MHEHFSGNLINVLTVDRNSKENVFLPQKVLCVSLRETQDSIKKLNTLIKCSDSFLKFLILFTYLFI